MCQLLGQQPHHPTETEAVFKSPHPPPISHMLQLGLFWFSVVTRSWAIFQMNVPKCGREGKAVLLLAPA